MRRKNKYCVMMFESNLNEYLYIKDLFLDKGFIDLLSEKWFNDIQKRYNNTKFFVLYFDEDKFYTGFDSDGSITYKSIDIVFDFRNSTINDDYEQTIDSMIEANKFNLI